MKARITLIARVILVAVLLGFALVFNSLQRNARPAPRVATAQISEEEAEAARKANAVRRGQTASPCRLVIPVEGVREAELTDTFTDARSHGGLHDAIDIMAPVGTAVIAAAPGKVEKLFYSKAGGNTVYVRSADGRTVYYYAHLDRYATDLREGDTLVSGDPIGFVGYSGNANPTAPHLHFAMMATSPSRKWWDEGEALNPFVYLTNSKRPCDLGRS